MTPQRIKDEAEKAGDSLPIKTDGDVLYMVGYKEGYIAGATAENDRAQGLVDALEAFVLWQGPTLETWPVMIQARKALEQWKGGKVEPPKPVASNCGMCGKLGNNQYLGNQFYLCDECFEDYEKGRDQPTPY